MVFSPTHVYVLPDESCLEVWYVFDQWLHCEDKQSIIEKASGSAQTSLSTMQNGAKIPNHWTSNEHESHVVNTVS